MKNMRYISLVIVLILALTSVRSNSREIINVREISLSNIVTDRIVNEVIPFFDTLKNIDENPFIFVHINKQTYADGDNGYELCIVELCNDGRIEETPVGYTQIGKYAVIVYSDTTILWEPVNHDMSRKFETFDLLDVLGCETSEWYYDIDSSGINIIDSLFILFPH